MTKDQEKQYKPSEELKKAVEELRGKKFRLDCGHYAVSEVMRRELSQSLDNLCTFNDMGFPCAISNSA